MDFQHRLTLWRKEIKRDEPDLDYDILENCTPTLPSEILSSAHGKIKEVLLIFPDDEDSVDSYLIFFHSYLESLTHTCVFLIVRDMNHIYTNCTSKIGAALHDIYARYDTQIRQRQLYIVPNNHHNFFMWPQDPFIVAKKMGSRQRVLFSPSLKNHNGKDNDNLADFFAQWYNHKFPQKTLESRRIKLHFQGGNLIIAHPLAFIGNASIRRSDPNVVADMHYYYQEEKPHNCLSPIIKCVLSTFKQKINPKKHFIPVGHKMKFVPEESHNGNTHKIVDGVLKCFQPFYHLDLFLNLVEQSENKKHLTMMLGMPVDITGKSRTDLAAARLLKNVTTNIDAIVPALHKSAQSLGGTTIEIIHIPLPMIYKKMGRKYVWYPLSFNNCLVEITTAQKSVWLPNYQFGCRTFGWSNSKQQNICTNLKLKTYVIKRQWEKLGFQVHLIDTSIQFVECLSGLHCLIKCLNRT